MVKYNIIPKPNSYISGDSEYSVSSDTPVICFEEFIEAGKLISDYLKTKPDGSDGSIHIKHVGNLAREAYALKITNDGVYIYASDKAGAYYGAVTFKTILMQSKKENGKAILNTLVIEDAPDNAYRGLMLDCCRHYFDVDTVKSMLENMAFLKLNKFHWHLSEDQGFRIESKLFPELNEIGSERHSRRLTNKTLGFESDGEIYKHYYTQDEIKDIVEFAAKRNIEVIPEIDLPGHTMAMLASIPSLSCDGEKREVTDVAGISDAILCAGNEETFEFLDKLLGEVCALFPSPVFHIGGDEAFKGYKIWEKCDKCQARKNELGLKDEKALQVWFMNCVCEILKKYGKTPVAWDDCMSDDLDGSIAGQLWRQNAVSVIKHQSLKRDIVLSPTMYFYFDWKYSITPLKKVYKFNKYKMGFTKPEQRARGLECELWTEWIDGKDALEFSAFPRVNAFAEVAWTKLTNRKYKDFYKRLGWYKTYMKLKGINYSRIEGGFGLSRAFIYHLGGEGSEYKKSMELKNQE